MIINSILKRIIFRLNPIHNTIFCIFSLFLGLIISPALLHAETGTNPSSGNINDYSGIGDWKGTPSNDYYINQQNAVVYGRIDMSQGGWDTVINKGEVRRDITGSATGGNTLTNTSTGAIGSFLTGSRNLNPGTESASNTINNAGNVGMVIIGAMNLAENTSHEGNFISNTGSVSTIFGSYNADNYAIGGGNYIQNKGLIRESILGSYNSGYGVIGGDNYIQNFGTITLNIFGSYNAAIGSYGGENIIENSGNAGQIIGSRNLDSQTGGGNNYLNNHGYAFSLIGSDNRAVNVSSGGNIINNDGITGLIIGSFNQGDGSSGGGNTIINEGTVNSDLMGTYNQANYTSSTGNIIVNLGLVKGNIFGSSNVGAGSQGGDDFIINSGVVGGGIYAADGDDTVTMQTGPERVWGDIDGGSGFDTLIFSGGAWTQDNEKLKNFENITINATHELTLAGSWDLGNDQVQVNGGALTVAGSLSANSLMVVDGTVNISGLADINGPSTFNGNLNIISGGQLKADSLSLDHGTASINGRADIAGATKIKGNLLMGRKGQLNTGSLDLAGYANVNGTINTGYAALSGQMGLNGTINSARGGQITASGHLWGNGTINGDLINHGLISPGNSIGTLKINSTLTFEPKSALAIELDANGLCDQITSSGKVIINGGALRTTLPAALYTQGESWPIITAANGVLGNFDQIDGQPDSRILYLTTQPNHTQLDLVVNRRSYSEFANDNATSQVGLALDKAVSPAKNQGGDMASLLFNMDWAYSAPQITKTLEAFNPQMYDAFSAGSVEASRLFDRTLTLRADRARQSAAFGLVLPPDGQNRLASKDDNTTTAKTNRTWSVWTKALGAFSDQKSTSQAIGYDSNTGGIVLGADSNLMDWLKMGLALGYTNSDFNWSKGSHEGEQNGMHAALYAQGKWNGFYLDCAFSYGNFTADAKRHIRINQTKASAELDSETWQARLSGGYDWQVNSWLFGPTMGISGIMLNQDSFGESGAGPYNLSIDNLDYKYYMTSLGFKAEGLWQNETQKWLPRLSLAWLHQFSQDDPEINAQFRNFQAGSFVVSGADRFEDSLLTQAGILFSINKNFSAFVDYTLLWADDYLNQTASIGLNCMF